MIKLHEVVNVIKEALIEVPNNDTNEVITAQTIHDVKNDRLLVRFTHDDLTENTFVIKVSLSE